MKRRVAIAARNLEEKLNVRHPKRALFFLLGLAVTAGSGTSAEAILFCAKRNPATNGPRDGTTIKLREVCKTSEVALGIAITSSGSTVEFSGVNVQVVSGSGSTDGAINGRGNLIVGHDEGPGSKTGSHNLSRPLTQL